MERTAIYQRIGTFLLVLLVSLTACRPDDSFENPYDGIDTPNTEDEIPTELDPSSFGGLHANIFRPTCANSGCHDGTFEPDFRTLESTYNTLVNHPIIKNDLQGTYAFRVVPNDPDASQLMARITYDIDGNSGIMPLVVDAESDWEANKQAYIQNIQDWIAAGAKPAF